MTPLEQLRAALEEIDSLIGMIDCTDKHNLALLPLFLAQQKRALAALARMEQPTVAAVTLEEALGVASDNLGLFNDKAAIKSLLMLALKEQP